MVTTTTPFGKVAALVVVAAIGASAVAGASVLASAGVEVPESKAVMSSPSLPMMARSESTEAVSPSLIPIYNKVPALNDSNSIVALSVSISARISPSFTVSPTFFNQVATVPSVMVSLKRGIVIFVAIIIIYEG